MARLSPFHARLAPLCHSWSWKEWAGIAAVCRFDGHSESEYYALRTRAGLIDVSPLYKTRFRGPEASLLLSRVFTRDIGRLGQGRVAYGCLVDPSGAALDDGAVFRLGAEDYLLTSSEPWIWWLREQGEGLAARLEDVSEAWAALALQGPASARVLAGLLDVDLSQLGYFRVTRAQLGEVPIWLSRTGYTGDLGYELLFPREAALAVWDALIEVGQPLGLEPAGLDALDVCRIEAGYVLQGVDYRSARAALVPSQRSTPFELGLGWAVDLDRSVPLISQARMEAGRRPDMVLVGVEIEFEALDAAWGRFGLPPHCAPVASRASKPARDDRGEQIGYVTSSTWSPMVKKWVALATLRREFAEVGAELQVDLTVEHQVLSVPARVAVRPFYDPPWKRAKVRRSPR